MTLSITLSNGMELHMVPSRGNNEVRVSLHDGVEIIGTSRENADELERGIMIIVEQSRG